MVELATDWFHLRGIERVRRSNYENADWFAKAAAKMHGRLQRLVDYLQVPGAEVLDEALVRVDGKSLRVFVGCEVAGAVHFWTVLGNLPTQPLTAFDELNTVTGGCLWSSQGVQLTTASGGRFDLVGQASSAKLEEEATQLRCATGLTGYEVEISERLDHGLAALVRGVRGPRLTVTLDIPREHYLLYILDAAQKGLIPLHLREYWGENVLRHSSMVVEHNRGRLKEFLSYRGRNLPVITQSNELQRVAPRILEQLLQNRVPHLGKIVDFSTKDPVWRLLFDSVGLPQTVQQANGLAYSAALLRRALSDRTTTRFVLELDTGSEAKIYDNVARVAKKNPRLPINAIAVLSAETFIALSEGSEGERPGTYHNDPGHHLLTHTGFRIGTSQLLRRLYPSPR
ncbi:hypothetical protein [Actinomadura sp. NBRC 104412]|uniref:hypothetical protein n=1 Tax=Actinomadura sp. NBRC 104412 TaxID=3032203 RepID=UPI002554B74C|nr:hypothetical protein [Actinomadura sp. NBRC 104412]